MPTKTITSPVAKATVARQARPAPDSAKAAVRARRADRKEPASSTKPRAPRATKAATPKVAANPDLKTSTKKSVDTMSEAHRKHIERWESLVARLGIDHVWANTSRFVGRGDGPHYLLLKVKARHYRIVAIDTSDPKATGETLVDDISSPKAGLEAFRAYRVMASAEKAASKSAPKADAKPVAKTVAKPAPKTVARKPVARTRKPATPKA